MMFVTYVGIEGFTLPNEYIVKELTLLYEEERFDHILFQPPPNFTPNTTERKSISYISQKLHHLNYNEGWMPYSLLGHVLKSLINTHVYCYGRNAANMLKQHLPTTPITDLQEMGYQMPTILPRAKCGRDHNGRYCSLAKALACKDAAHIYI